MDYDISYMAIDFTTLCMFSFCEMLRSMAVSRDEDDGAGGGGNSGGGSGDGAADEEQNSYSQSQGDARSSLYPSMYVADEREEQRARDSPPPHAATASPSPSTKPRMSW